MENSESGGLFSSDFGFRSGLCRRFDRFDCLDDWCSRFDHRSFDSDDFGVGLFGGWLLGCCLFDWSLLGSLLRPCSTGFAGDARLGEFLFAVEVILPAAAFDDL